MTFIPRKNFTTTTILNYHKAAANDKKKTHLQTKALHKCTVHFIVTKMLTQKTVYNKIGVVKAVLKGKLQGAQTLAYEIQGGLHKSCQVVCKSQH